MSMRTVYFSLILLATLHTNAQSPVESQLTQKMDQGVSFMNQGMYAEADKLLTYSIKTMTTLPSDLAYYFGKNSFYISKYKQSINWLNKYIQLKGTSGRFHEDAIKHLKMAEEKFLAMNKEEEEVLRSELQSDDYDCGGLSKMICPVCKGEGVTFRRNSFETLYKTCTACSGDAYLSCEDYNLFMLGKFNPSVD